MDNTKILHDVATGEITEVELTANEIKELQKKQALAEKETKAEEAEAKEKATAKAAILDRIGLTVDELKTILG
jgi:Mn-containing catalase